MLNKRQIRGFNLDNSYDFWQQMVLNYKGKLYTWAIFWYFAIYINNGLTLFPRESLLEHIGYDSGEHFFNTSKSTLKKLQVKISLKSHWEFPEVIEENKLARRKLIEYFNSIKPPLYRSVLSKVLPDGFKKFIKRKLK